jgi:hypothetical protein
VLLYCQSYPVRMDMPVCRLKVLEIPRSIISCSSTTDHRPCLVTMHHALCWLHSACVICHRYRCSLQTVHAFADIQLLYNLSSTAACKALDQVLAPHQNHTQDEASARGPHSQQLCKHQHNVVPIDLDQAVGTCRKHGLACRFAISAWLCGVILLYLLHQCSCSPSRYASTTIASLVLAQRESALEELVIDDLSKPALLHEILIGGERCSGPDAELPHCVQLILWVLRYHDNMVAALGTAT